MTRNAQTVRKCQEREYLWGDNIYIYIITKKKEKKKKILNFIE